MADGGKVATYGLNLETNAPALGKEAAASVEKYRTEIERSEKSIKELAAAQRALRGSSDEVKEAKASLKAKIDAERGAISQANLAILKHGTNYQRLTTDLRKNSDAHKNAIGPMKGLTDQITKLGAAAGEGAGAVGIMGGAAGILAVGLVGLTAAALGGAYAIGKFVTVGGDVARSMSLQREAVNGGAENAKNWGEQIDALARKVSTPIEQLNKLSVSISKSLSGGQSRANGQTIIDTFNAVAEAADAAGDDVGSSLQSVIEDGKRFGRIGLDPSTLQGKWNTGWEDISHAVAKNLGVSLKEAKASLLQHRVSLDAGAKAIRDAVETRFGEINAKKLISLDSLSTKLHDNWMNLTKGFSLEPILGGLKKVVDLFDVTAVEGYALKGIFTDIGKELGANVDDGVSIAKTAIDELILGFLDLEIEYYSNKKAIADAFKDTGGIEGWKTEVSELVTNMKELFGAAADVAKVLSWLGPKELIWLGGKAVQGAGAVAFAVEDHLKNNEAKEAAYNARRTAADQAAEARRTGSDLSAGVAKGAKSGAGDVSKAMIDVTKGGIDAARGPQGADAHSPSRKTTKLGKDLAAGIPRGVEGGQADVDAAMASMANPRAASPAAAGASSGAGASASVSVGQVNVEINVTGGGGEAHAVAAQLSSRSFLGDLTKAIRQAMVTQGVPTQAPPVP